MKKITVDEDEAIAILSSFAHWYKDYGENTKMKGKTMSLEN